MYPILRFDHHGLLRLATFWVSSYDSAIHFYSCHNMAQVGVNLRNTADRCRHEWQAGSQSPFHELAMNQFTVQSRVNLSCTKNKRSPGREAALF